MAVQLSPDEVQQLQSKVYLAAKDNQSDVIRECLESLHPDMVKAVLHEFPRHQRFQFTPLVIAAMKGHLEVVELLVNEFKVSVTQEVSLSEKFDSALVWAAAQGHLNIVEFLVKNGCNVSARGEEGFEAAYKACKWGHKDVLKYLVENGVDINGRFSSIETTCLMAACTEKRLSVVEYLLSTGANTNDQDVMGRTALHWAARINAPDIIALLLNHGAVLSRDHAGRSPLIVAALTCARESVYFILQFTYVSREQRIDALELLGACQVEVNPNEAFRLLSQAMEERYKNPDAVLLKPHSPVSTLSNVQESQTLQELQARQADQHMFRLECLAVVNRILGPTDHHTTDSFFCYFLLLKCSGQHKEATAVLLQSLQYGVGGISADRILWYIREFSSNFAEMVKKEISGFFPDVEQVMEAILSRMERNDRLTARFACIRDKTWLFYILVGLLVARGQEEGNRLQKMTERYIRFDSSSAVLHAAVGCQWDRPEEFADMNDLPYGLLVPFLVQCGADVHLKDGEKNTALHEVAFISQKEEHSDLLSRMAKLLVQAGALVGVKNREGKTPLDLAGPAVAAELQELYPVSLKSLAATVVINSNIPYATEVPKDLKEFVDKH